MIKNLLLGFSLLFLSSCSHQIGDYQGKEPAFDLARYFNGTLIAHGLVQDYTGKVTRRFKAEILAKWQGNRGILDERFEFDDGEISYRCWQLTKRGDRYTGTAGDVIGTAEGEVAGNTLNWAYYLNVPVDDSEYKLWLDDWLYLLDDKNLINKTEMRMWGVAVGEVTLFIQKQSEQINGSFRADCQLNETEATL